MAKVSHMQKLKMPFENMPIIAPNLLDTSLINTALKQKKGSTLK